MESLSQPMSTDPCGHRKELVERLDVLRRNENFCDVTITVKGKEFKAHRAVLAAASPFFLSLLTSDMRESNEGLTGIDLEEATESVMEDVLKYIYTGNVLVTEERAHDLLATANYLFLPGLKTVAGNFLQEVVSVENCVFNYYFADKYQCVELKAKCCDMIKSNFSVVMETDDFLNLDVKQVMEWVSCDDITVSAEEEVFKGILKWVSHNKSEREGDFPELLHQVRLTSVSRGFLVNVLKTEKFVRKNEVCSKLIFNCFDSGAFCIGGRVKQQPRKCLDKHRDFIFVCGGTKALCYFPQQNLWYRLADTPFEHKGPHTLCQYEDTFFIFDAQENMGVTFLTEEHFYDDTNSWVVGRTVPFEKPFSGYTVLKDDLYGMQFSYSHTVQIYIGDARLTFWVHLEPSPFIQVAPCVVSHEQFLYIIGGLNDGDEPIATATRFDTSRYQWEEVAALNERRYSAFGVAMDDRIFIAGGRVSWCDFVSSCEVYNPTTNEWQLMPGLKVPRSNASMVCFQGKLYVLGGSSIYTDRNMRALSVEVFDLMRNDWVEISAIPVSSFETQEEEEKNKEYKFKACFAILNKVVIDKLNTIPPL